jgi:hypothetical protein
MTTMHRAEKTLPADFVQGLVESLFHMHGPNYKALLLGYPRDALRRTDIIRRDNPLLEHISGGRISGPVDYAVLRCTFDLFFHWYDKYPSTARKRAYIIGRDWWCIETPGFGRASVLSHPYALQHILGADISAALRAVELAVAPEMEPAKPDDSNAREFQERFRIHIQQQQHIGHQNWQHKVRVACRVLAQQMQQRSGIAYHISETRDTLTLEIPVCPFCANERADCGVFRGVIDGMLVWLHQTTNKQHEERYYETIDVLTEDKLRLEPDPDDWHRLTVILALEP